MMYLYPQVTRISQLTTSVTSRIMAKILFICLIMFLVSQSVSSFKLRFKKPKVESKSEEDFTSKDMSTTNDVSTTQDVSTTLTTTTLYPPYDPNDACRGCPAGQSCQMVIPPCLRPPAECYMTTPDPLLDCAQYANYCKPIPLCIDVMFG
ncbi:hypothetical protein Btru_022865 [Bulinus truncatus]|nr:hypothetical protein Btru_022865 [Bulinus truncatus]